MTVYYRDALGYCAVELNEPWIVFDGGNAVFDSGDTEYNIPINNIVEIRHEPTDTDEPTDSINESLELAELAREIRFLRGISQRELAELINATQTDISLMERGFIPNDTRKISKLLEIGKQLGIC